MGAIEITAELQPKGPAAAFVLSEEQAQAVGEGAKRFPATTTINGDRLTRPHSYTRRVSADNRMDARPSVDTPRTPFSPHE